MAAASILIWVYGIGSNIEVMGKWYSLVVSRLRVYPTLFPKSFTHLCMASSPCLYVGAEWGLAHNSKLYEHFTALPNRKNIYSKNHKYNHSMLFLQNLPNSDRFLTDLLLGIWHFFLLLHPWPPALRCIEKRKWRYGHERFANISTSKNCAYPLTAFLYSPSHTL